MNLFKAAPKLVRAGKPLVRITEALGRAAVPIDASANALVIDARTATSFGDLSWLHSVATAHAQSAAFRKPGGRVVLFLQFLILC